jgi:hypothetical protein
METVRQQNSVSIIQEGPLINLIDLYIVVGPHQQGKHPHTAQVNPPGSAVPGPPLFPKVG